MKTPVWELFKDGTAQSVDWIDHKPNTRFAIYKGGTAANQNDDLVLDKETGLVWPRNANLTGEAGAWQQATAKSREIVLANRVGWRLPTVEELCSLVDRRNNNPALPTGHPFLSVRCGEAEWAYWTSTNLEESGQSAWFVNFTKGEAGPGSKVNEPLGFVWPVRGGRGGVSWNWVD